MASTTTGDLLLGRSSTPALVPLADVIAGQVLKSGGVAADPVYSPQYVQSLASTANQITVSVITGDVTLSLPSELTVPGGMTLRYMKHAPEAYFAEDAARIAASMTATTDAEAEARAKQAREGLKRA